tara:strand:+ start:769 stop:1794 length:1026 start_codon:yes stop_codon:yes gene_type:complete
MAYIGVSPSNGVRTVFDYTATAGQTSFSGSDNNSQTLSYTDSAYIDVYQNGVLLIPSDYTATTGTSVVLDTGATVSDSVQIVVYDVFSVADTVSKANGGTFESNISIGGTLGVTGVPTFTGRSVHSGGITIANGGQIGSVGDADAMAISSSGVVSFTQTPTGIGNNFIRIAQTSVTSATATVDFNSSIIDSSTYRNFFFTVNNATCASGNYDLEMRFSSDNLSNFMTVIGQYEYQQLNGTDTGRQYNRSNHVVTVDEENDETNASSGYGYILNANRRSSNNNTTNMFIFSRGSTLNDNASGYYSYVSNSVCGSGSDPLNAIRFTGATNITAGIFTIYGIPS